MKTNNEISNLKTVQDSMPASLLSTSLNDFLSANEQALSYHEMSDVPVRGMDPLEQLQLNLMHLSDASARLRFMNKEIRYLLRV
jgi:hypothetical protein